MKPICTGTPPESVPSFTVTGTFKLYCKGFVAGSKFIMLLYKPVEGWSLGSET